MPWTNVCYDVFGHLVRLCLAALQDNELNTRDAPDEGPDTGHSRMKFSSHNKTNNSELPQQQRPPSGAGEASMSTMTRKQMAEVLNTAGLALDETDVDALFEHLSEGGTSQTVSTIHVADFIALSWTSEHENWLLRKAYRKLDPNCTGVVSYKTLENFTAPRNATLTTHQGVREISSFTGLGIIMSFISIWTLSVKKMHLKCF